MGSCSLLQRIFPTQGSNPGLLHCRQLLYQLSHKGSPSILEWVAIPSPSDLPNSGTEPDSLPTELSGKPLSSVQSLSRVRLLVTAWTAACQASLSTTHSWSLLRLMSIESVAPSNHLILCHPLLFLPSIFPSIRVFSTESVLCFQWPTYRVSASSVLPMNV